MISAEHIKKIFERNLWVINKQVEGVTHEESLLQADFRANTMNWVLGHLLWERQAVLELLGMEPVAPQDLIDRYAYESEPITTESEGVFQLGEMLEYFQQSEEKFAEGFSKMDDSRWNEAVNDKGTTLWMRVEFLAWHEAYHVGQLELLRQLTGKDDKII
jgi:uncharacterized damage-inducible protein DinB